MLVITSPRAGMLSRLFATLSCLQALVLPSCATTEDAGVEEDVALPPPASGGDGAVQTLGAALALGTVTHREYRRLRDQLSADRFQLIDSLTPELRTDDGKSLVRQARDELDIHMRAAGDLKLQGRLLVLVEIFAEVSENPRGKFSDGRFADFVTRAVQTSGLLEDLFGDVHPEQAKKAYYLAAAFNVVTAMRVVALATLGTPESIDAVYRQAIAVNSDLVGDSESSDGMLGAYIAKRDPRQVSEREKFDADPVVYFVRQSLAEQKLAVE